MQLGRRAQILLIVAVGLAVFYPVIFAEFCYVDDVGMIQDLRSIDSWSLKRIFIPGNATGMYYRPLIHGSFLVDRFLLDLDPVWLHLHNVTLHLLNALLVYCLALSLLSFRKARMEWLPITAALGFCLHPIVTESVGWVSGRTDLLASAFVLSSALMLLRFRMSGRKGWLVLSVFHFLLATLSKEVSLAFFPGMLLILTARGGEGERETGRGQAWPFFLAGLAALLLFFLFRSLAFSSNESRIGLTLISIGNDLQHAAMVVLGAFGFYMKKVVLPLPLNFAIVEVDPLYQLLALPLVAFCAYLLSRETLVCALFLSGVFLIAPSFVIAFGQIAWTPYAERYLYLPTAFMILAILFYLGEKLSARPRLGRLLVIVLLPLMAATTLARNLTWRTNYGILKDTVEKSPYFPNSRLLYASVLADRGELDAALDHARRSIGAGMLGYDERAELCVAGILQTQGKTDEAIELTELVLKKRQGRSPAALLQLVSLWKDKVTGADASEAAACNAKLLESYRLLYAQTKDPLLLYRMGGVSAALGRQEAARSYFRRSIDESPAGSDLKWLAGREIARSGGL